MRLVTLCSPVHFYDCNICVIYFRPPSLVVADFGCGDCKIARSVKNKVHSFDLAAACELVTVCDMADVSVFLFLCANSCPVCVSV